MPTREQIQKAVEKAAKAALPEAVKSAGHSLAYRAVHEAMAPKEEEEEAEAKVVSGARPLPPSAPAARPTGNLGDIIASARRK